MFLQLATGAIIPMEFCDVLEGQIMRKQFPQEKTTEMVRFSTKKPADRLNSIRQGLGVSIYSNQTRIVFDTETCTSGPRIWSIGIRTSKSTCVRQSLRNTCSLRTIRPLG